MEKRKENTFGLGLVTALMAVAIVVAMVTVQDWAPGLVEAFK